MPYRPTKQLHTTQKVKSLFVEKPKEDHKGYNTNEWKGTNGYSYRFRATNPRCKQCNMLCQVTESVVDHIIPVSQGGSFWDIRNHQTLCKQCHNSKTQKEKEGHKTPYQYNEDNEMIPLIK